MPLNITEFFTPAVIEATWNDLYSNTMDYAGQTLFPARQKAGLDLAFLKGSRGLPITLMPSAFDAKATFRDRIGFEKLETEMPFFREGFKIKERDRQELLRVQDANDPYAQTIIDRIFDDAANLIEGAEVAAERMRMQLLFPENGNVGISIKANGVDYTYNYDPNGKWKAKNYTALTGADLWTATDTADPFRAIQAAKDGVRNRTGTNLTMAWMNTNTLNMMIKAKAIRDRYLSTNTVALSYLTPQEAAAVVSGTVGVSIAVYDKQYQDESRETHSFVPDGYVALTPGRTLGYTWRGTTPEEADLQGNGQAEVSIVNNGVAITRIVDPHPVNVNIFACEIVLPSYEQMDEVAVLKVIA